MNQVGLILLTCDSNSSNMSYGPEAGSILNCFCDGFNFFPCRNKAFLFLRERMEGLWHTEFV